MQKLTRLHLVARVFRVGAIGGLLALGSAPTATAEIQFFTNRTNFENQLAGHELIGVEDFEDARIEFPDAEAIDDPLDELSNNRVYQPGDILSSLRIQANTLGEFAPSESPAGSDALFVRDRTGGTISKTVRHNSGANSYDVIFSSPVTAMSFDFVVTTKVFLPNAKIDIWTSVGELIGQGFSAASGPGVFVGIIAKDGETLDRVNLYRNSDFSAYVGADNIVAYGPPTGHALTLSSLDPGVPGELNQVRASQATPGETVFFLAGRGSGDELVPSCGSLAVGLESPRLVGSAVADGAGTAQIEFNVPPVFEESWLLLQAVELSNCLTSSLSLAEF